MMQSCMALERTAVALGLHLVHEASALVLSPALFFHISNTHTERLIFTHAHFCTLASDFAILSIPRCHSFFSLHPAEWWLMFFSFLFCLMPVRKNAIVWKNYVIHKVGRNQYEKVAQCLVNGGFARRLVSQWCLLITCQYSLMCLMCGRYYAICCQPLVYRNKMTPVRVSLMLGGCWVIPLFISFLPIMQNWNVIGIEDIVSGSSDYLGQSQRAWNTILQTHPARFNEDRYI